MASLNWRAADVARALKLSKGYVSYILKGEREPSVRVMDSFRRLIEDTSKAQSQIAEDHRRFPPTEAYVIQERDREDAQEKLARVAEINPRAFDSIRLIIDSFAAQGAPANSAEAVALGAASELDVAGVPHPPATPLPKRAAPAPSAHTPPPAAPAPPRRGGRPAAPKPAPTAPES